MSSNVNSSPMRRILNVYLMARELGTNPKWIPIPVVKNPSGENVKDAETLEQVIARLSNVEPIPDNPRRHYAFHAADLIAVSIIKESLKEAGIIPYFIDEVSKYLVNFLTPTEPSGSPKKSGSK